MWRRCKGIIPYDTVTSEAYAYEYSAHGRYLQILSDIVIDIPWHRWLYLR